MEALEVPIEKKLIVVGDGDCGKTALLIVFAKEDVFQECSPTIYANYVSQQEIITPMEKKLIVVGDGACGKTCLLIAFAKDEFQSKYCAAVFENCIANFEIDGIPMKLTLVDTAGQEEYDRIRPLQYPGVDVVLICFSVVSHVSLLNVSQKWYPEVRHFCPNIPILLVGTQNDLRDDKKIIENFKKIGKTMVTEQQAQAMAKKIGAVDYIECSALTRFNVDKVFTLAAKSTLLQRKYRKKRCGFL